MNSQKIAGVSGVKNNKFFIGANNAPSGAENALSLNRVGGGGGEPYRYKKYRLLISKLLISAFFVLLIQCGGGSGGGDSASPAPAPDPGTDPVTPVTKPTPVTDYKLVYESGKSFFSGDGGILSPKENTVPADAKVSYAVSLKDASGNTAAAADTGIGVNAADGVLNIKPPAKTGTYKITVTATPANALYTGTLSSPEFALTVLNGKDIAKVSSLAYSPVEIFLGTAFTFSAAKSFPADVSVDYSVTNDKNATGITVDASGDVSVSKDLPADIYTVTVTAAPKPGGINYGGEKKAVFTFRITSDPLFYKPGTSNTERGLFTRGDTDNPYLFQVMDLTGDTGRTVTGTLAFTVGTADFTADLKTSRFLLGGAAVHGIGPKTAVDFNLLTGKDITIDVDAVIDGKPYKTAVSVKGAAPGSIYNWRDLQNMKTGLSGDYVLMNGIVFPADTVYGNPGNFTPVGNNTDKFTGNFDGNGKTVGNFKINGTADYTGLFGTAQGTQAVPLNIKNVTLEHAGVTGGDNTGVLAGFGTNLNISGVSVKGTGAVTGKNHVGALIGSVSDSAVNTVTVTGDVTGSGSNIGGLIGAVSDSAVNAGKATGAVTGKNNVGGLIGITKNSAVNSGTADGTVKGTGNYVGGLIGFISDSAVNAGKATGSVTGNNIVGGLIGEAVITDIKPSEKRKMTVSGSSAAGYVTSTAGSGPVHAGGLIGVFKGFKIDIFGDKGVYTAVLTNSYAKGNVNVGAAGGGNNSAGIGGLVGSIHYADISGDPLTYDASGDVTAKTYASGDVIAKRQFNVGGLVGLVNNSPITIMNTKAGGTTVNGDGNVGGLIGNHSLGDYVLKVHNCTANANVRAEPSNVFGNVGGLIGTSYYIDVYGCRATGNVIGIDYAGGLVVRIYKESKIKNSYATGNIEIWHGDNVIGGLVGKFESTSGRGQLINSYFSGNVNNSSTFNIDSSDTGGGGLVGIAVNLDISGDFGKTYSSGNINMGGQVNIGGLVGFYKSLRVRNAYSTATVNGKTYVGGLLGRSMDNSASSVKSSYFRGNVNGKEHVGGIIGDSEKNTGELIGVYSLGNISGEKYTGGIAGRLTVKTNVKGYAVGNITGTTLVGGLTGETVTADSVITGYFRGALNANSDVNFITGKLQVTNNNIKGYYNGTKSVTSGNGFSGTQITLDNSADQKTCSAADFPDLSVDTNPADIGDFVCVNEGSWPAVYMGDTTADGFSPGTQPTTKKIGVTDYPF